VSLYMVFTSVEVLSTTLRAGFSFSSNRSKRLNPAATRARSLKPAGHNSRLMSVTGNMSVAGSMTMISEHFPGRNQSAAAGVDDCSLGDAYEIESILHREQMFAHSLVEFYGRVFHTSILATDAAARVLLLSAYLDMVALITTHAAAISDEMFGTKHMIQLVSEEISSLSEHHEEVTVEEKRSLELDYTGGHGDSGKFRSLLQLVSSQSKSRPKHCSGKHRAEDSSQTSRSESRSASRKGDTETTRETLRESSHSSKTILKKKSLSMNFQGSLSGLGDLVSKTVEAGSAAAAAVSSRQSTQVQQPVVQQVHYVQQPTCYTCQYHR
jgi:hypothetical protein